MAIPRYRGHGWR
ncbi:hypothetical protein YPPY11_3033, partial [Yersinia pestis PY-11]